jgi:hypothetical protein
MADAAGGTFRIAHIDLRTSETAIRILSLVIQMKPADQTKPSSTVT